MFPKKITKWRKEKEMVRRQTMNTLIGFVPSVMIRVFNFIIMRFFYYLYFLYLFVVKPRSNFRHFNPITEYLHAQLSSWLQTIYAWLYNDTVLKKYIYIFNLLQLIKNLLLCNIFITAHKITLYNKVFRLAVKYFNLK